MAAMIIDQNVNVLVGLAHCDTTSTSMMLKLTCNADDYSCFAIAVGEPRYSEMLNNLVLRALQVHQHSPALLEVFGQHGWQGWVIACIRVVSVLMSSAVVAGVAFAGHVDHKSLAMSLSKLVQQLTKADSAVSNSHNAVTSLTQSDEERAGSSRSVVL